MRLLHELIETLSSEKPNLTDTLMKTKVLLHELGRKDLAMWVNSEVNGYDDMSVAVPEYRLVHATVRGNCANIAWQFTNHQLPTLHLEEKWRKRFVDLEIRESVSIIEKMTADTKSDFKVPIPLEANQLFSKALENGVQVQTAWSEISFGQFTHILTQVRSRLLDFLLELQDKVGEDMTKDEVKKVGQSLETGTMFSQAIYGNNNTILIGTHNVQSVVNKVKAGDFAALVDVLKENGVEAGDIARLQEAVVGDDKSINQKGQQFGTGVKNWMASMLTKAVNTSWQIEVAVAANLLTDALKAYYGWLK